ncbi:CG0192 family protein [Corynebacterium halotolerans]|uniref:Maltokinase N-terminal cap domain-containing protein n=1 Tax=Corynebacterium halotolerans YIM 70093 = DSM 44683 TaxID=1121362 RepID=M1P3I7_9CORY|nr:hypothetical protein [Corynebacterium halotolerans]AGF71256.1 hypothetical protein A605_01210 [Corynebacterium halotolerans YIM 70093 = DSM 44683]
MSGIAKIYDAVLNPTKEQIAGTFGGFVELLGSYRLVDPDDEVGIEVLIGTDLDGRIVQLPLTYRGAELDPEHTLTELEHNILGHRWVSNALGDPVAVTQLIRTILTGDDGAKFSDGTPPALDIIGSGDRAGAQVSEVRLSESTRQRAVGTVRVDDRVRGFRLHMPRVPLSPRTTGQERTTARLNLTGSLPSLPAKKHVVAELHWRDL